MNNIVIGGLLVAVTAAAPAAAKSKPDSPYCTPKVAGLNARGILVSSELTQTAGSDTATKSDDRWSGEITVDVKRVNHKGLKGEQTYTLDNARVKYRPRNDANVAAGDRVKVSGRVTKFGRKCAAGETTVKVRKLNIKAAKA